MVIKIIDRILQIIVDVFRKIDFFVLNAYGILPFRFLLFNWRVSSMIVGIELLII